MDYMPEVERLFAEAPDPVRGEYVATQSLADAGFVATIRSDRRSGRRAAHSGHALGSPKTGRRMSSLFRSLTTSAKI